MQEIASGNAFLVNTPNLDNLTQRLYMEGRQRALNNQRNIELLDNEYSKNVSNIRDADVDDLTKAYQDYKSGTQALMKVKGGVSPQQQMEVLRKKAAMYKLINESKAEREREELTGKRYATNPDDFNDDAAELLIAGRNLPVNKKREYARKDGTVIDLTNPENYMYQDKINWQPVLQKAAGTTRVVGKPIIKTLDGGLEDEVTTYKAGNNPIDYYSSIVGSMNTPRASQSLATRYSFTPEEAIDIATRFEERKKDEDFKNAFGDVKFPESSNTTDGTRTAKLLTMKHYLDAPITSERKTVKKLAETTANSQQFKEKQATTAQERKQANIRLSSSLGMGNWTNKFVMTTNAVNNGIDLKKVTVDELIDGATNQDGVMNISPELLGIPKDDYATNVRLKDGKVYWDVTIDGKTVTRNPITLETAKREVAKRTGIELDKPKVITPQQRLPKDIKNTKMNKKNPLGLDL